MAHGERVFVKVARIRDPLSISAWKRGAKRSRRSRPTHFAPLRTFFSRAPERLPASILRAMVRLHGAHRTPEMEAGFREWLVSDPEHARQFERVTDVWDKGAMPVQGVTRVGAHAFRERRSVTWQALAAAFVLVVALGTTFVVRHERDRIDVTLVEGRVAVAAVTDEDPIEATASTLLETRAIRSASGSGPNVEPDLVRVLKPGQRLRLKGGVSASLDEPKIETVTAWRRGEVMLERTTLTEAIAEMNRYDRTILVIEDPEIAALRVSGIYHAGNNDAFATTVARLHGLELVRGSGQILLRQRPDAAR